MRKRIDQRIKKLEVRLPPQCPGCGLRLREPTADELPYDLSKLSVDELWTLRSILAKALPDSREDKTQ